MKASAFYLISSIIIFSLCNCSKNKATTTKKTSISKVETSVIRVNSTIQKWNPSQPWDKSPPSKHSGLGALLNGNRVLTTAEMAADATYIELENADNTLSLPAKLIAIDYEANLALLEADSGNTDEFFKDLIPLELAKPAQIGDNVEVWQLEDNGMALTTTSIIQSVDVSSSFTQGHYFLNYKAKGSMQNASNSFTLPVSKNGELLGLLSTYNAKDQLIDIIAPEIISDFLKDAEDGQYDGFPSLGVSVSYTVDPNFRNWLKLSDDIGGLYVTFVTKGSAAELAGVEKGDVITMIDKHKIGRRGYYSDENYGRLFWSHLIRGSLTINENIELTLLRDGEEKKLTATLTRPKEKLVPTNTYGQAPRYLVKGGFIFQELTINYLSAYGEEWPSKAPLDLLDILSSPEDYEKDRNRIVILTATIPTQATTGYESLRNLIVSKVNGQTIADIPSLIQAFQTDGADNLHTIEFDNGRPKTIYLDATVTEQVDNQLLERGIPNLSRE